MSDCASEQAIIQNLRDAGCDSRMVEEFMACTRQGDALKQLRLLSRQRRRLLERVHREEKRIDCLDYLLHRMRKETAKTPF